jgi:hypothetical protein
VVISNEEQRMNSDAVMLPDEVVQIAILEHGAPADLAEYYWWKLESAGDVIVLTDPDRTISLEHRVVWHGHTVLLGWSEDYRVGGFAFVD